MKAFTRSMAAAGSAKSAAVRKVRPPTLNPITCEHEYTEDEWEFIRAVEQYQKATGRRFPALSEIYRVLIGLGYSKGQPTPPPPKPARKSARGPVLLSTRSAPIKRLSVIDVRRGQKRKKSA